MTVQEIIDRMQKSGAGTTLHAGAPELRAKGIAVTYTPSIEVLRKAVDAGRNIILSQEGPYWTRKPESFSANATFIYKRDFIGKNNLALLQMRNGPDFHLRALAEALSWNVYQIAKPNGIYFKLPETSLEGLAASVASKLNIRAARVIGDPHTTVAKVALTHGRMFVPALQKVLQEPGVDAVIIGEPVEWEASPYFQDLIASGQKKGLIALGLEATEEPGGTFVTSWLKTLVPEVEVEWIPAGEPFSVLT